MDVVDKASARGLYHHSQYYLIFYTNHCKLITQKSPDFPNGSFNIDFHILNVGL